MTKTYVFRSRSLDPGPLQDGLVGIFNTETDPRSTIEVRKIRLLPVSGTSVVANTSILAGKCVVQRITAMTVGAGDASAQNVRKHDTNSADLPAEVVVCVLPDSVTATDAFRYYGDAPQLNLIQAGSALATRGYSTARSGGVYPQVADVYRVTIGTDLEPIILNEGEGLAVSEHTYSVPHGGAIGFIVTNTVTGATYSIRSRDTRKRAVPGLAYVGIMNGTGSGITLAVRMIEMPEEGDTTIPYIRIARIIGTEGGTDGNDGILSYDTQSDSAYAGFGVSIIEGPFRARLIGEDSGMVTTWHTLTGTRIPVAESHNIGTLRNLTYPVQSTNQSSAMYWEFNRSLVFSVGSGQPGIVLRPNEGLGVLAGRAGIIDQSTFNCYQVEITFTVHPPTPDSFNIFE